MSQHQAATLGQCRQARLTLRAACSADSDLRPARGAVPPWDTALAARSSSLADRRALPARFFCSSNRGTHKALTTDLLARHPPHAQHHAEQ